VPAMIRGGVEYCLDSLKSGGLQVGFLKRELVRRCSILLFYELGQLRHEFANHLKSPLPASFIA
jgi:hypothetical protein